LLIWWSNLLNVGLTNFYLASISYRVLPPFKPCLLTAPPIKTCCCWGTVPRILCLLQHSAIANTSLSYATEKTRTMASVSQQLFFFLIWLRVENWLETNRKHLLLQFTHCVTLSLRTPAILPHFVLLAAFSPSLGHKRNAKWRKSAFNWLWQRVDISRLHEKSRQEMMPNKKEGKIVQSWNFSFNASNLRDVCAVFFIVCHLLGLRHPVTSLSIQCHASHLHCNWSTHDLFLAWMSCNHFNWQEQTESYDVKKHCRKTPMETAIGSKVFDQPSLKLLLAAAHRKAHRLHFASTQMLSFSALQNCKGSVWCRCSNTIDTLGCIFL